MHRPFWLYYTIMHSYRLYILRLLLMTVS